jgi:glutathione synthase
LESGFGQKGYKYHLFNSAVANKMPPGIEKQYPPNLSAAESEQIVSTIKDWSIANGLAVRPPPSVVSAEVDPHGILATTAPVTLFPSPFPRVCFEQAKSIQTAYNTLYASIAQDEEFLEGIVKE